MTREFGLLVACFGVGAAGGLLILRQLERRDLALIRTLLILLGAVVATMSQAPAIGLALLGALGVRGAVRHGVGDVDGTAPGEPG